jgi:hypothetical protein
MKLHLVKTLFARSAFTNFLLKNAPPSPRSRRWPRRHISSTATSKASSSGWKITLVIGRLQKALRLGVGLRPSRCLLVSVHPILHSLQPTAIDQRLRRVLQPSGYNRSLSAIIAQGRAEVTTKSGIDPNLSTMSKGEGEIICLLGPNGRFQVPEKMHWNARHAHGAPPDSRHLSENRDPTSSP